MTGGFRAARGPFEGLAGGLAVGSGQLKVASATRTNRSGRHSRSSEPVFQQLARLVTLPPSDRINRLKNSPPISPRAM
jgi:hypothetical protein